MLLEDIVMCHPEVAGVLVEYGLHCFACPYAGEETLEEGARMHGFDDAMLSELVDDMNSFITKEKGAAESDTIH